MIRRLYFLFAPILFSFNTFSQPITFNTHVDVNENSDWGQKILQLADSSFVILSPSACYSSQDIAGFVGCIVVVKTDRKGNVLWKKEYISENYTFFAAGIMETTDGSFFIGGETTFPHLQKDFQKFLFKISSEGDSLWLKHYGRIADEDLISDYTGTPDRHLLLLGEIGKFGQNDSWDMCLTKLDQEGNLIWQKKYGGDKLEGGSDIAIDSDGGYLLGGVTRSFSADGTPRAYLIKTDTAGNELWSSVYDYCDDNSTSSYVETLHDESGYLMSCSIDSLYADGLPIGITVQSINRFDREHNRLWTHYIEREHFKGGRTIAMKDGSIWKVGASGTPIEEEGENPYTGWTGWIAKLSSEGELLWERQYLFENKGLTPRLTDLVETHDGGVALTGLYMYLENGITRNDIWLLKLDQNGCIESGCDDDYLILGDTVVGIEDVENEEAAFEVYPNPSRGLDLRLALSAEVALKADLVLEVYSMMGAKVGQHTLVVNECERLRSQVLGLEEMGLKAGLYLFQLKQGDEVLGRKKVAVN